MQKQKENEGLTWRWRRWRRRRRWKWWFSPENVLLFPALVFFCYEFSFFLVFFVPLFSAPFYFSGPLLLAIYWPFIGCHVAYLPRIMIRHGDIVFQSDWGTDSPAPVGLFSISMRAWKIYPYLPGVVIFTKISFANWVLVGLECRCFNISVPSVQASFQRPRKRKRNSACLKRCVSDWKWPFLNLVLQVSTL